MAVDVVVVGSCMTDLISYVPRLPKPGETLHGDAFMMGFGGKGANQCIAAAKLGAKVAMVGKVGNDIFGDNYMNNFKDHHVNCEHVHQSSTHPTGMASISVAKDGANSIVIVAGANLQLTEEDVLQAESLISKCKVLVCQLEIDQLVTLAALKLAKKHGVLTILNPAPAPLSFNQELIKYSDIICPNETESEIITKFVINDVSDAVNSLPCFFNLGCQNVIITLGSKGCVFASKSDPKHVLISAPQVSAVDTTGAGDAFVGSLAYCLSKNSTLSAEHFAKFLSISCDIATLSVKYKGTQNSYQNYEDLPFALKERLNAV